MVQLAGDTLVLTLSDRWIALHPGRQVAFAGNIAVSARVSEPATVLNVMTDRSRFAHRIDRWAVRGDRRVMAPDRTVIVALTTGLQMDDVVLEPLDAVSIEGVPAMLSGTGTALAITITPRN